MSDIGILFGDGIIGKKLENNNYIPHHILQLLELRVMAYLILFLVE